MVHLAAGEKEREITADNKKAKCMGKLHKWSKAKLLFLFLIFWAFNLCYKFGKIDSLLKIFESR